ncbi:MAG: TauD/TfdA family dioxygenase [Rhodospirillales bacterium]|nr:TauD/TfdA family dioxygenase [Rhodospirillales bacterium]
MPTVKPLSPVLGAEVTGVDLGKPLDDATVAAIETALDDHLVVVLPGQTLTPAAFTDFARRWGRPEPHVIDQFHHPESADILILSNVKHGGKPVGLEDAGSYFHTDYSYLDVPARCTMLYAIQMPASGANLGTTFANQRKAWEDLDPATKKRLEGLVGRHHYGNRDNLDETTRTVASPLNRDQKAKLDWVRHPVVRTHPRTGRKTLYSISGSSFGIEGMDDAEAVRLLDELKVHATQPKYLYQRPYRVGDVVIWDNCCLLHQAPLPDPTTARTLWRITVKDKGPTLAA